MNKRIPLVAVVDMDNKETEYPVVLSKDTKSYTIKPRGNHQFKLAFKTGQVAEATGDFMTIPGGNAETEDGLNLMDDLTLYVSCEIDGDKMEVKTWR